MYKEMTIEQIIKEIRNVENEITKFYKTTYSVTMDGDLENKTTKEKYLIIFAPSFLPHSLGIRTFDISNRADNTRIEWNKYHHDQHVRKWMIKKLNTRNINDHYIFPSVKIKNIRTKEEIDSFVDNLGNTINEIISLQIPNLINKYLRRYQSDDTKEDILRKIDGWKTFLNVIKNAKKNKSSYISNYDDNFRYKLFIHKIDKTKYRALYYTSLEDKNNYCLLDLNLLDKLSVYDDENTISLFSFKNPYSNLNWVPVYFYNKLFVDSIKYFNNYEEYMKSVNLDSWEEIEISASYRNDWEDINKKNTNKS